MAVDSATALDEFSTSLLIMNAHPLHNIAKATELTSLLAVADESCAFVFAVVALSMQIHFREFPLKRKEGKLQKFRTHLEVKVSSGRNVQSKR